MMVIDEWSMNVEKALAFTPAAITSDANVWRQSCRPIGLSSATFRMPSARWLTAWFEKARQRVVDGTA